MAEQARGRALALDQAPVPPTPDCSDSIEKEFGGRLGQDPASNPDDSCHPA